MIRDQYPDLIPELVKREIDPDAVTEISFEPEYVRSAGRYFHSGIDAEPWNEKRIATGRIEVTVTMKNGQRTTFDVFAVAARVSSLPDR